VTPTAVSHQLRELELFCGLPLLRRRPRPLALTLAGERLFPVLRDGFDAFAASLETLRDGAAQQKLRVTTTNAFAHRWLVPRMALWRQAHPEVPLEVVGTDRLVDLGASEADIAIRYAFVPPPGLETRELVRDRFWPLAAPALLRAGPALSGPADLLRHTLVHADWYDWEQHAPTWRRWIAAARAQGAAVPEPDGTRALHFQEELHALEAVVSGQGIGICSDVLAARELAAGTLVKAWDLALPGFGFYLARPPGAAHPVAEAFWNWAVTQAAR
jgi:LysR family glycine cleavage system transcriptional activator